MTHHNPERRTWKGRSFRKGGERVSDLRDHAARVADSLALDILLADIPEDTRQATGSECPDCGATNDLEENGATTSVIAKGNKLKGNKK